MKKLLSFALAGVMLLGSTVPAFADETPAGLTLAEGSHLVLDSATGYIDKIDGTITVGELKANFDGEVSVAGKADDDFVATDDAVGEYKALIYGDVNRDGKVNLSDVSGTLQKIAGWAVDVNADAADVNKTGDVTLTDVTKLLKKVAGWEEISLGNVRWIFEDVKLDAEYEDPAMTLFFDSAMVRHGRNDNTSTGKNSYRMKMAKGEYESCQFFLASEKDAEGLTVELSEFVHEFGEGTIESELLIHFYYKFEAHTNILEDNYPTIMVADDYGEPLLPLADSFEVAEGRNQGFHINVQTTEDTPAGMYKARLTIKDAQGNEIKCADVYTYVWDFVLPVTPNSASAFAIGWYDIASLVYPYTKTDPVEIYAEYYEFLLNNNCTAYSMPYDVTDERADAIMSDPRVTYFTVMGGDNMHSTAQNDEEVAAFYEKINTNPVWKEKAAVYLVDEPYGPDGARIVREKYTHLNEVLGGHNYKAIMPHGNSIVDPATSQDVTDFIGDWVDILVPTINAFQPNFEGRYNEPYPWTPRAAYQIYGESAPRYTQYKADGKTLWWYVCCSPQYPYPNLFVSYQGVMSRVLWWQQFMFDVDGFLYWSVTADWGKLPGNLRNDYPTSGDGNLIYFGERYGRSGPVLGWRFVHVRDGFDDFDYLRMAEELCGRDAVMSIVNKLTTGITHVKEDPYLMETLRGEVAKLIEANQK